MNLETVIRELRETKLPALRQRQLCAEAAHSPSDAERALLVARARQEAQTATQAHLEHVREELRSRMVWASRNPPREPQEYVPPTPVEPDRPQVRPVTVTWTTPRKPDISRQERRAEVIGSNRKVTPRTPSAEKVIRPSAPKAKPAPVRKPQIAQVVKQPSKSLVYTNQPPVALPDGRTHGATAYRDFKCRCEVCREGKRLSRTSQGLRAPRGTIPEHGTNFRYVKWKCRDDCPGNAATGITCREAAAQYAREARERKALEGQNRK